MSRLPPFATRGRVIDAVFVVACGIGQAAAIAVGAFATRAAFVALHDGAEPDLAILTRLGAAGLFAALCLHLFRYRAEALGQSYAIDLRRTLFTHIAGMPKLRHAERRIGALSLRFVGDLSAARLWFGRGLPHVLSSAVVLPGAALVLFALDTRLGIAGSVPLAIALMLMLGVAWHLEARHRSLRSTRANLSIAMIERIGVAPELDLLGRTTREVKNLDARSQEIRAQAVARVVRTSGLKALLQAGLALGGVAVLWTTSHYQITPGTAAAALSVLALLALPMRQLAQSWDEYCAWHVARDKANALFAGPSQLREPRKRGGAVTLEVQGEGPDGPVDFHAGPGSVTVLERPDAAALAYAISGLGDMDTLEIHYEGDPQLPICTFIGDMHIALQGSLRRDATLLCTKRPSDRKIIKVLRAFDLDALLDRVGLDGRIAEGARGLSADESLRLDLARAALGRAELVVIASCRWDAAPDAGALLNVLQRRWPATVVISAPTGLRTQAASAAKLSKGDAS